MFAHLRILSLRHLPRILGEIYILSSVIFRHIFLLIQVFVKVAVSCAAYIYLLLCQHSKGGGSGCRNAGGRGKNGQCTDSHRRSFREKERKFFLQKSKTVEIAKYLSWNWDCDHVVAVVGPVAFCFFCILFCYFQSGEANRSMETTYYLSWSLNIKHSFKFWNCFGLDGVLDRIRPGN